MQICRLQGNCNEGELLLIYASVKDEWPLDLAEAQHLANQPKCLASSCSNSLKLALWSDVRTSTGVGV